jgi:hypothetical protein
MRDGETARGGGKRQRADQLKRKVREVTEGQTQGERGRGEKIEGKRKSGIKRPDTLGERQRR